MNKDDLKFDVSQAHELKLAFRRNGWTNSDIKALSEKNILSVVLKFLNEKFVNLNKRPVIPSAEAIMHSNGGGLWEFNPEEVFFCTKSKYSSVDYLNGFNANLLDFLLKYPHLIPEEWKQYDKIFFPGTVYTSKNDFEQLRYLSWGTKWATKIKPQWWDGTMVIDEIAETDKKLVFAMRVAIS